MARSTAGAGADAHPLTLEVRRTIARPAADVFAASTNPRSIERWFTDADSTQVHVDVDARVGGRFHMDMMHQGVPWRQEGTYVEIVPDRRLTFTWVTPECPAEVGSLVTVDFQGRGGSTDLVLRHVSFPNEKTRADHEGWWREIVAKI